MVGVRCSGVAAISPVQFARHWPAMARSAADPSVAAACRHTFASSDCNSATRCGDMARNRSMRFGSSWRSTRTENAEMFSTPSICTWIPGMMRTGMQPCMTGSSMCPHLWGQRRGAQLRAQAALRVRGELGAEQTRCPVRRRRRLSAASLQCSRGSGHRLAGSHPRPPPCTWRHHRARRGLASSEQSRTCARQWRR